MDEKRNIITEEDCYKILESHNKKHVCLLNYSITKTSDAVGFLGDYFQLKISFKSGNQVSEEVFFVKTEPISNQNQKDFVQDCGLFKKEAFIYQIILPELMKSSKICFAPQCFLVKEDVLVLEDLKHKNFNIVRRDYTLEECVSLIRTLAHFHASTIIHEEKNSKSGKNFSFKKYLEKIPEGTFSFEQGNPKYNWLTCVTSCLVDLMRKQPFYDENIEKKLLDFIFGGNMKKFIEPSQRFRNVFTHCDLWSNNIFLHENNCALVDFQLVRCTPPCYDLIMALHLNTSKELLEDNLAFFLEFYYDTLTNILRNHQLKPEVILPLTEFYESVKIYKTPALIESTMFSITVYLPDEKSVYIRSDSERYHSYTFSEKTPFVMDALETNTEYRNKVFGLLSTLATVLQTENVLS